MYHLHFFLVLFQHIMDPVHDKNKDEQSTTEVKIHDLYHLIHSQRCCMMTTRCADSGRLVSRAMAPCPVNHYFCVTLYPFLGTDSIIDGFSLIQKHQPIFGSLLIIKLKNSKS